jgi:hypothetical protein
VQGYNAQAVTTLEQVIVAEPTQQANDLQQLDPTLAATAATLAAAGIRGRGGSCAAGLPPVRRNGSCCAAPTTCSSCGGTRPPDHRPARRPPEPRHSKACSKHGERRPPAGRGPRDTPQTRQAADDLLTPPLGNRLRGLKRYVAREVLAVLHQIGQQDLTTAA